MIGSPVATWPMGPAALGAAGSVMSLLSFSGFEKMGSRHSSRPYAGPHARFQKKDDITSSYDHRFGKMVEAIAKSVR